MRPLGQALADQGYTVLGVRLAGHGTNPAEMATTTWLDWYTSLEQALAQLRERCTQVFVIGLSMGGLLSLHAVLHYPVTAVISINAPIYLINQKAIFAPILRHLMAYSNKKVSDETDSNKSDSNKSGNREWNDNELGSNELGSKMSGTDQGGGNELSEHFSYDKMPLACLNSLLQLMRVVRKELSRVNAPLLVLQSEHDEVVNPKSAAYIYAKAGSADKTLEWFPRSGHLVTLGVERDQLAQRVIQYIQAHV